MILQYAPDVEGRVQKQFQEREPARPPTKSATKKKNKPMSKHEQEQKISQLSKTLNDFERQSSGSQEPVMPSKFCDDLVRSENNVHAAVEKQEESSGDEDSDSEEE